MGRASHKQAGSYIAIQTLMPAGELLGLAETIALQVFKRRADKPGPVVVTGRGAASIDFAVTNLWQKAIMRFRVSVAPATDGGAALKSQITYFRTRQPQILGFIPSGPKKLVGWDTYSTFMKTLEATVHDSGRGARVSIVTAAG
jgi:hypothetical protein